MASFHEVHGLAIDQVHLVCRSVFHKVEGGALALIDTLPEWAVPIKVTSDPDVIPEVVLHFAERIFIGVMNETRRIRWRNGNEVDDDVYRKGRGLLAWSFVNHEQIEWTPGTKIPRCVIDRLRRALKVSGGVRDERIGSVRTTMQGPGGLKSRRDRRRQEQSSRSPGKLNRSEKTHRRGKKRSGCASLLKARAAGK